MLFSRNPISGVVEVYTDEGEYVGKIGMMGDEPLDDKSEGLTEDGGEGSGNHHHAGRPGQVGGSAPSGKASESGSESKVKPANYIPQKGSMDWDINQGWNVPRRKYLEDKGHNSKDVERFEWLIQRHIQYQHSSDDEIKEFVEQHPDLIADIGEFEKQAAEARKQIRKENFDKAIERQKESLWALDMFDFSEADKQFYREQNEGKIRTLEILKSRVDNDMLYRHGGYDGEVISFTTNPDGVTLYKDTDYEQQLFPDHKNTLQELMDMGIVPVSGFGAKQNMYAGEGDEITFVKLPKPLTTDGGPGSGNHNHAGRPGQVGGSAKEGSASAEAEKPKHNTGNRVKFDTSKMPTLKNFKDRQSRAQGTYNYLIAEAKDDYYGNEDLLEAIDRFEKAAPVWNNTMRDAFDKFDFSIRADGAGIEGILTDGRVKTQFETGTSNGYFNPNKRREVAEELFGCKDVDDSSYEVYGFLDDARNAIGYGDFRIVLDKDKVYNRATFTIGDSLDQMYYKTVNPSFVNDPHLEWDAVYNLQRSRPDSTRALYDQTTKHILEDGSNRGTYIELQFHGGITTDDIDYIEAKYNPNKYSEGEIKEITRLARDKGVAIRWV